MALTPHYRPKVFRSEVLNAYSVWRSVLQSQTSEGVGIWRGDGGMRSGGVGVRDSCSIYGVSRRQLFFSWFYCETNLDATFNSLIRAEHFTVFDLHYTESRFSVDGLIQFEPPENRPEPLPLQGSTMTHGSFDRAADTKKAYRISAGHLSRSSHSGRVPAMASRHAVRSL
jgi:hypothetical protein